MTGMFNALLSWNLFVSLALRREARRRISTMQGGDTRTHMQVSRYGDKRRSFAELQDDTVQNLP